MINAEPLRLALFTDTYPPQVNGVARTLAGLRDAVRERGGDVRVFTTDDPESEAETPDAGVLRFPAVGFWAYDGLRLAWPSRRAVRDALIEFRPTLVHAATEFGVGIAGRVVAKTLSVPFVSSYHTSFTEYAGYYKLGLLARPGWRYLRWFHNGGLRTYSPTRAIAAQIEVEGFRNTRVWSRGVDTMRFNPSYRSADLRARIGADDDTLVVAYVGRLAAEKGIGTAINALRIASEQRPGRIVFVCVGSGPYEAEVRRCAPPDSWLPGKLVGGDLSMAYASSDLFVFPSTTDTFGNVMLEAMASGLAVLGADVGPTREIIGRDRGWLAPPSDAAAFARAIVRAVDDRAELRRAQQCALEFAQRCTWEQVWDALIADYLVLHRSSVPAISSV
jgi:glycosyltransferase involved in cell wall biosynthesis